MSTCARAIPASEPHTDPDAETERAERELLRLAERLLTDPRDEKALEAWLVLLRRGYLPAVALGPPLQGRAWTVPDVSRHHAAHAASVFALDLAVLDERGRVHAKRGERNEDYASWDALLLAVADGSVVRARDEHPDDPVGEGVADPDRANDLVLRFDGGLAFYQHLRQGTLRVEPGQRVKRGDVLAAVGNSGNATWPHLHFAVYEPFEAAGESGPLSVPIAVGSYHLTGLRTRDEGKTTKVDVVCSRVPLQAGWIVRFEA